MSTDTELENGIRDIENEMRSMLDGRQVPYDAAWKIWSQAMSLTSVSPNLMHPFWLIWGALTDWVENRPVEVSQAEFKMRQAASEWLKLNRDHPDDVKAYCDRWVYDVMGYQFNAATCMLEVLATGYITVSDAHEPCHAGSLYVEGVFPDGDRGGNEIKTKQSEHLHALWDGLLGPKWSEGALNRRADETPTVNVGGNIEDWLAESRELAVKAVYPLEVMEPVSVALRGKTEVAEVSLLEAYLKNAGAVAKVRAAEAE